MPTETLLRDEDLLPRVAARDEAAVALLLERWWARGYRFALSLTGDPGAAEDVAQDAFVQVLRAADEFDPRRAAFSTWFLRIVRNAALNATRATSRRTNHEAAAARTEGAHEDPGARVDAAAVAAHLQAISPTYRDAVALHYLEGLTFQEVAQVLNCPLGTVASRVRRGLEALRARVTTSTASLGVASTAAPDATLIDLLVRAHAQVVAPAAPPAAAVTLQAGPPLSAALVAAPARTASRWPARLAALLALLGLLAAGAGTAALLLHDSLEPAPRVASGPTRAPTAPGEDDASARARRTGLVVPDGGAGAPGTATSVPPGPAGEDEQDPVDAVAYDATGARAIAGRRSGAVDIWDLERATRLHRLVGHEARVSGVAFTPDGVLAVTASSDGTARVWEAATGREVHLLRHGEDGPVLALAVSPDGLLAATGGGEGDLRLWSLSTGLPLHDVERAHAGAIHAAAFDPRGNTLLSAGADARLALRTTRGELLFAVPSAGALLDAVFDGPDHAIGAVSDRVVRFDLRRREVASSTRAEGPLAISPPGVLSRDRGVLVRRGPGSFALLVPGTWEERVRLEDDVELLLCTALSPDGAHALTGAESGRLKVWDLRPREEGSPARTLGRRAAGGSKGGGAGERVVIVGADEVAAAPSTTRLLPNPGVVDVDAIRRELATAPEWRRRELVLSLDPRDPASLALLLEVLASADDWIVRRSAVQVLAMTLDDPRVQAGVLAVIERGGPARAQEGVTLALAHTRDPFWVPRLVALLASPEWIVRRAAAIGLGQLPDARAVEPLVAALEREGDARVASLLHEALERITRTERVTATEWREWWQGARLDFVVGRRGPSSSRTFRVQVAPGPPRHESSGPSWVVRVRGQGPPALVLTDLGYDARLSALTLRWLEAERTVVYVSLPDPQREPFDVDTAVARLAVLRHELVEREALPDQPELVVAHGLACFVALEYPKVRPAAAGLALVAPWSGESAWRAARHRVERAAHQRGDAAEAEALRVLHDDRVQRLHVHLIAELRQQLFTSRFADTSDLLIGHLLGERIEDEHDHALEWEQPARFPRGVDAARRGWHDVPTVVVVAPGSPWTSLDDARDVAEQSTRGAVVEVPRGALHPAYEDRDAFAAALRAVSTSR